MAEYRVTDLVGTPVDYSDANNWGVFPQTCDKEVDTFFVYPTVYINPMPGAPAIVPIDDVLMRTNAVNSFAMLGAVFEDATNVYMPFYRQSNLLSLSGKNTAETLAYQHQEQRTDVFGALDYYFEHYNQGRPFILAGHSQGSMMVKIALREYFKEHADYLDRMIAAYVLGFSITTDDLEANPALRFAEGADDTGVIVSWNVEGPENKHASNITVMENAIAINPLNWKRDDTYAPASENLGDKLPINDGKSMFAVGFQENRPGVADAQIDVERGVVVCTTLSDRYITSLLPGMSNPFGPASLHLQDYPAYWENIKENVQTRIQAYFNRTPEK